MTIQYIQLQPYSKLPDILELKPFRSVLIIEDIVAEERQMKVSEWLVASGCLYMMAWGKNCSSWDDSVDIANLKEFSYEEIPDDRFVMTTWHENEPLKDVYFFSKYSATHPLVEIDNTLLVHISMVNKEKEFLIDYEKA